MRVVVGLFEVNIELSMVQTEILIQCLNRELKKTDLNEDQKQMLEILKIMGFLRIDEDLIELTDFGKGYAQYNEKELKNQGIELC